MELAAPHKQAKLQPAGAVQLASNDGHDAGAALCVNRKEREREREGERWTYSCLLIFSTTTTTAQLNLSPPQRNNSKHIQQEAASDFPSLLFLLRHVLSLAKNRYDKP